MFAPLVLASCVAAAPVLDTQGQFLVFPPPQSITAAGGPRALHPAFQITSTHRSAILIATIDRYSNLVAGAIAQAKDTSDSALSELHVRIIGRATESLDLDTLYNYTLEISADKSVATATASSVFGAQYALESFTQLLDDHAGALVRSSVTIRDAPDYAWRGLMIDSGRR